MKKKYENPKFISAAELAKHNSEMDCWTCVDGRVYNLTPFVKLHPGGKKILRAMGIDGTQIFRMI
jgi:cytochrome b involved in lipid metabolism